MAQVEYTVTLVDGYLNMGMSALLQYHPLPYRQPKISSAVTI